LQKAAIILFDFAMVMIIWMISVALRISILHVNAPVFRSYLEFGAIIGIFTVISFTRHGLYDSLHFRSRTEEFFAVLRANCVAILIFILFAYLFAEHRISRGTLLIYGVLSCILFLTERFSLRAYLRWSRSQNHRQRNFTLVGNGETLKTYISVIALHPHLGIKITSWVHAPAWASEYSIPVIEENALKDLNTQAYVISFTPDQQERIDAFLKNHYDDVKRIFVLPDLRSYSLLGLKVEDFSGLAMLALNQPSWSTHEVILKRMIDLVGSAFGLIFLSPLFFVIAVMVKLTSSGPVFFGQERMGLDGATFKMWKFRSMKVGRCEPGWTTVSDPRRTPFGSFLRSTSLDELPQLWNVLVGQMSLVGPRPEQPHYVESFRKEIPAYMLRHKVKAGITGWAQVNGWRGDTSLHKRIECDLYYIKNWSMMFDFKILVLTLWKGFINRNAY
jgi:Undecaprenyl-phosphate glucose phosphotransferase